MRCARMDERSAQRREELAVVGTASAMFGDLARAARDDVLMAFAAALGVVSGPQAVGGRFDFLEDEPIVVERSQRDDRVLVQGVERRSLRVEPVRQIVESRQGFGGPAYISGTSEQSGGTFVADRAIVRKTPGPDRRRS